MARLIFENISLKAAKTFAEWYEGQGEQDADLWFEIHDNIDSPKVDVQNKDCIRVVGDDVIVRLKE
jgi:hypothetical protein